MIGTRRPGRCHSHPGVSLGVVHQFVLQMKPGAIAKPMDPIELKLTAIVEPAGVDFGHLRSRFKKPAVGRLRPCTDAALRESRPSRRDADTSLEPHRKYGAPPDHCH